MCFHSVPNESLVGKAKFLRFVIWSFDYNWRIGGVVVLHKLAELLAESGFETYCVASLTSAQNKSTLISRDDAAIIAREKETIVIYPENVVGNPLDARSVARWVLYFPGWHGGDKEYSENEFVFTFNPSFVKETKYAAALKVRIIESMSQSFFDKNQVRTRDAILVKKGEEDIDERFRQFVAPHLGNLYEMISVDSLIRSCESLESFNSALNEIRYFISFDSFTYHSTFAALAGCASIAVPFVGVSRDEYFAANPSRKSGIAYGFEDLKHQRESVGQLRANISNYDSANWEAVTSLIHGLTDYFGL